MRKVITQTTAHSFIPTGCHLLDLSLGGGWATGRIANIVGDKSSGKTLLMIEACANYARLYDPRHIRYGETEAAFLHTYAKQLGMPDNVSMTEGIDYIGTVEKFFVDLTKWVTEHPNAMYIVDSLDALSDEAEAGRNIGDASFGTGKAKLMSEGFRRTAGLLERVNATLLIVSQIRDKINVMFGETKTRSGGKALDFYASQIVWLAETGKIERTIRGNKRAIGVKVLAKVKKNKITKPHRQVEFPVYYGYGIDDELSMIAFLKNNKAALEYSYPALEDYLDKLRNAKNRHGLGELNAYLREETTKTWNEIEAALEPAISKYE